MNNSTKRALVFPGQGAQSLNMGYDLYQNFNIVKQTYAEVNDTIRYNLCEIIFGDSLEILTQTKYAQIALMTTSAAILNLIEHLSGKKIYTLGEIVAGHSLGEYTALYAAKSLTLKDGATLLNIRGNAMQDCCKQGDGAMAAILNVPRYELDKILNEQKLGYCQIANDNSYSQVVISGDVLAVDTVISDLKLKGYRAIKLNVSAPFHSKYMQKAADELANALEKVDIKIPKMRFIANIYAKELCDPTEIKASLTKQVTYNVLWRQTIDYIISSDIDEIIEIGAGSTLTNMIKRDNMNITTKNIATIKDIENFISNLN